MRQRLGMSLVALLSVVALASTACGDDKDTAADGTTTTAAATSGGDRGNVDGVVKFGTLVPQSGDLKAIEPSLSTPIDIAMKEINDAGGVLGKDLVIVPGDDGTSATVAQTTYDKLVNSDKVDAIIGPAPSGVASKLADSFGTDKVPACSGSTTAANLQGVGNGYFFRTAPGDNLQGPALAQLILGDAHQKVSIIARNDDYGKGFSDSLKKALEGGGATVGDPVLYDPAGSNFDADVQKVVDQGPEAVAVIGFNDDGAKIINAMIGKGVGPAKLPIYTADGMQSSSFATTVDPSDPSKVSGIKGTAPAGSPAGITSPFQDVFKATGVDPIFSAYYYDCTMLMALAAQKAGSDDGTKIKDAFASNLSGDVKCNTYKDCLAALKDGKTIHYQGASSTFDKWDVMQPGTGSYEVWSYGPDGKVVTEAADKQILIS